MIFHENLLLADDSHVISYLIFVENWERCQNFFVCCSRDWRFKGSHKTLTFVDAETNTEVNITAPC